MTTNPNTPSPSSSDPPLRSVQIIVEKGLADDRPGAYRVAREILPAGVVVRLGRRVLINEQRLDAFTASGGRALPGGWRRDAGGAGNGGR